MAGTFQENKRIANQIVSCYNIQKSEGSRGGKVIGHTKSGKAIYATTNIANSKYHKDWTIEDHKDAAQVHKNLYIHHSIHHNLERSKDFVGPTYSKAKQKQLEEEYKGIDKKKIIEGSSFEHNPNKSKALYHLDSAEDHRNMMNKHLREVEKLEKINRDSLLWEGKNNITKSEENQSIESVKKIGETKFMKINGDWKYYKDIEIKKGGESIQEGHELVTRDGIKGKVISNDGENVTLSYEEGGEVKEAQVPLSILEQRKQNGEIQHNSTVNRETNISRDEVMKSSSKKNMNEGVHHYIHKNWDGKSWNYDYGQHFNGTRHVEENNYSEESERNVKTKADLITKYKEKIEGMMSTHDSWDRDEKENLRIIQTIINKDGRDSSSTNPMKSENYKLQSRKQTNIQNVHKLHNNLVTLLER